MLQPGRKYEAASGYRYGFNGKENDNDVKGEGNQQDYGMRIYDPRLGKFLSVDPLSKSYPWNSPYAFAENDVIRNSDLDGAEKCDEVWHFAYKNNIPVVTSITATSPGEGRISAQFTSSNGKTYRSNYYSSQEDIRLRWITTSAMSAADGRFSGVNNIEITQAAQQAATIEQLYEIENANFNSNINSAANAWMQSNPGYQADQINKAAGALWFSTMQNYYSGTAWAQSNSPKPQTTSSTNKQATAVNNGNTNGASNNTSSASLPRYSPIRVVNTTPQNGSSFSSESYALKNGLIKFTNRVVTSGTFDFVVTNEGKLEIGLGHYNLSGSAASVRAAGQLHIYRGKVTNINNSSGHYEPSIEQAKNFGSILKAVGVDVSRANLNIYSEAGKKVQKVKL